MTRRVLCGGGHPGRVVLDLRAFDIDDAGSREAFAERWKVGEFFRNP